MRIAQVAPLIESVPPRLYGGTERVVAYLTDELVRLGHDVTLFASGDSRTSAKLVSGCERALRLDPRVQDPIPHYMIMLDRLRRRADEFDVFHFHIDALHYPIFRDLADRTLTTLHGRQDLFDLGPLYQEFNEMPLVSISHDQRRSLPPMHWLGTVYHGLPEDHYAFHPEANGRYLAFLGRICPEKRVDRAIEIARRAGMTLKIAAKVDKVDEVYFNEEIRPLLDHASIEFVGEIGEAAKGPFLGGAQALLFPVDWPEPFGLVMIEAMACGTPVIAYPCGSVPEVIEHGVTGFLVETIDDAADAVGQIGSLHRARIRERFCLRFSAERMAKDYLNIYWSRGGPSQLPAEAA